MWEQQEKSYHYNACSKCERAQKNPKGVENIEEGKQIPL